jgi:hypothetical protein
MTPKPVAVTTSANTNLPPWQQHRPYKHQALTSEQPPHCHFPLGLRLRTLMSQLHSFSSPREHARVTVYAIAAADTAWTYAASRLSANQPQIYWVTADVIRTTLVQYTQKYKVPPPNSSHLTGCWYLKLGRTPTWSLNHTTSTIICSTSNGVSGD